jgi:isoleucyl-tRNA synthetase
MPRTPKKKQIKPKPDFLGGEFQLPSLEEQVLKYWEENHIFEKSLEVNLGKKKAGSMKSSASQGKTFIFYEGPPTANGRPGVHHILSRAFKDAIPRYKTMRGFHVPRKGGWDTHGLPVELQVEKQLGLKSKKEIEQYGIAAFNEKCRASVWEFREEWERLTKRMGFWLDIENPYVTYELAYMETLWWIIAQFNKKKLLYKGHRVVPWCTRCGTSLSSHELAQGYKEVSDNSLYVKFKLRAGQSFGKYTTKDSAYILSWTTTPWTLPGNVALAVGEKISYAAIRVHGVSELYILASDLVKTVFRDQAVEIVHNDIKGKDLVGLAYEPLFDVKTLQSEKSYKVHATNFVTTTDGTGVVHTAVMYGEDDYNLGKKLGLPQKHTVDEEGKFMADVPGFAGLYVKAKETEEKIFDHLKQNGNLLRIEPYKHEYPHCWRCGTPILYYARSSWFVEMSKLRKQLIASNKGISWTPEHIKDGRFGEWLREVKDWNFSRERYWGTPLPIWECKSCDHREIIGSLDELDRKAKGNGGFTSSEVKRNHYFMMRHGQAFGNEFGIIDSGNQKFHLTAEGRREVSAAAQKLKSKKIDIIFASNLERTKESAEILKKTLGVSTIHYDDRLHEIFLASLSGTRLEEYHGTLGKKMTDEERLGTHAVSGAESLKDVRTRAWSFMKDVEKKYAGKNIVIVSHEDVIWMLSQAALGWSDKKTVALKDGKGGEFVRPGSVLDVSVRRIPRDISGEADMHRPFIDEIVLSCSKCHADMHRVPEVADVWYDSGSMPFAQEHWPFEKAAAGGRRASKSQNPPQLFPADYICEGVDQTRGWFYTLLAVSTALGYKAPYKNVTCLGHINDKNGQKMSKSKGNIVDPWTIMGTYGVDAIRWYFYTATPPGEPKNFDEQEIAKTFRKVHLIIYNSFIFWKTYGGGTFTASKSKSKNVLDQWILARLDETIVKARKSFDSYDIREAGLAMESFLDDLSRWYIRRSRRRLQKPESKKDHAAASETLGFSLLTLAKLMAPMTPFFSEMLYAGLHGSKESVHLDEWPKAGGERKAVSGKLIKDMASIREVAALGLAKRAELKIKVRQPLASLTAKTGKLATKNKDLLKILADEVNVKEIRTSNKISEDVVLDPVITPELREEGMAREIARMVQELRQEANLEPKDDIALHLQLPENMRAAITKRESFLKSDVGAKSISYARSDKANAFQETKIDSEDVWIGIRKI